MSATRPHLGLTNEQLRAIREAAEDARRRREERETLILLALPPSELIRWANPTPWHSGPWV